MYHYFVILVGWDIRVEFWSDKFLTITQIRKRCDCTSLDRLCISIDYDINNKEEPTK